MEDRREVRREQHGDGLNTVVGKETEAVGKMKSKGEEWSSGKDVGRLELYELVQRGKGR